MSKIGITNGKTKKMELLAPAGSWEALVAAVANGADAVYLGGTAFSARAFASNFGPEELVKALDYAHVRGVKIFVTANTLVKDGEIKEALEFLRFLYEKGADGVILQDFGLARLAGKALPELRLHASTQMTVHNLAAARLLEGEGFSRIVLSREMSLENVATVAQGTKAEIEVFVHGALCVSYSGQCLMSSLIGGRSGNRGRCAQPCRMEYALVDEKGHEVVSTEEVGKHLLSPRDLNMLAHLPELAGAGVDSLKIEGRMKRPEYVATVIRIYREALDRFYANPEGYVVKAEEGKELAQIFNRGFTTGYFFGHPGAEMMSYKRPNNRGIKLGRVAKYDFRKKMAAVTLEEVLRAGDGIEIWVTRGGRQGITVHQIWRQGQPVEEGRPGEQVEIEVPGSVRTGDRIFKTHDKELINRAQASFTSPREIRQVPVEMQVTAGLGKPLVLTVSDGINKVEAKTDFLAEKAQTRPLTREALEEQLGRLGNAPFRLAKLVTEVEEGLMVPLGEINKARREAVDLLTDRRAEKARRRVNEVLWEEVWQQEFDLKQENGRKTQFNPERQYGSKVGVISKTGSDQAREDKQKPRLAVAVVLPEAVEAAAGAGADIIYIGGENFSANRNFTPEEVLACRDVCRRHNCLFYLSTPRLLQDNEADGYATLWELAKKGQVDGVLVANLGFLEKGSQDQEKDSERGKDQERQQGQYTEESPEIFVDYPLNIFNSSTIAWLAEKGFRQVTLSPELNMGEIEYLTEIAALPVEVLVHGAIPMMVTEYCVVGSMAGELEENRVCRRPCRKKLFFLRDRLGLDFPLRTDQNCHSYIFNPKTLDVWEEIPRLVQAGVSTLRLELKINSPSYVARVTAHYRQALDEAVAVKAGRRTKPRAGAILEDMERLNPRGLTKGHFFRGV